MLTGFYNHATPSHVLLWRDGPETSVFAESPLGALAKS
jgi:hypothetical protein